MAMYVNPKPFLKKITNLKKKSEKLADKRHHEQCCLLHHFNDDCSFVRVCYAFMNLSGLTKGSAGL